MSCTKPGWTSSSLRTAPPTSGWASRTSTDQLASSSYDLGKSADKRVEFKQWDLRTGREVRTLYHRGGWRMSAVAFSPDGRTLYSSTEWGGILRIWDADSGKETGECRVPEPARGVAVSRADGLVAFGSSARHGVGLVTPHAGAGPRLVIDGHLPAQPLDGLLDDGQPHAPAGQGVGLGAARDPGLEDGRQQERQ